jgi:regulatory protein
MTTTGNIQPPAMKDDSCNPQAEGDPGRITDIVTETSGTVRRSAIYVNRRLAIYALPKDVAGLAVGERIPDDQLEKLQMRYERAAYLQAIRFLGTRDRSIREVQQHLQKRGWDQSACDRSLERLKQEGLLDDQALAEKWVAYRGRTSPRSCRVMSQELQRRGIARDIILTTVASMDEKTLALACAQKKRRQWRRYQAGDDRLKHVMAFLQRKGFPYAICRETAHKLAEQGQDD